MFKRKQIIMNSNESTSEMFYIQSTIITELRVAYVLSIASKRYYPTVAYVLSMISKCYLPSLFNN